MTLEKHMEAYSASGRESSAERMEALHSRITIRDTKQAELVALIARPDSGGSALTNAWLQLEIAQGDLDGLVKAEIQYRLQN
jgi:hypothetical protein